MKIKINLDSYKKKDDLFVARSFDNLDIEFLLRYLEINNFNIESKFKKIFAESYLIKLSALYILLYSYFLKSNDIRFLNVLFKNIKQLKELKLIFENELIHEVVQNKIRNL